MKHSIDLSNYQIRTDLVNEIIDNKEYDGIKVKTKIKNNIKIIDTLILKNGSEKIGKKKGHYVALEFDDITDYEQKEEVKKVFCIEIKKLLQKLKIDSKSSCLVVGLGNIASTPDSLGPVSVNNIIVTKYLTDLNLSDFRPISAISPGVTGTTGIETSLLIKSIIDSIKPDFLIVVDALASGSIDRVNKTIQITDTGIHPGSGVGNTRKEISKEILGIPVIAIGVPTVVDATVIVSDTFNYMYKHYSFNKTFLNKPLSKLTIGNINYLKQDIEVKDKDKENLLGLIGKLSEEETKQLIYEVLTPIGYNLMVTPKEIDFIIDKLGDIIGNGINRALNKQVKKV